MELCANNCLNTLNDYELQEINGGTGWGVAEGVAGTIGGVAEVAVGITLLCTPEPTGGTKFVGVTTIIAGVGQITGGAVAIASNI